MPLFAVLVEGRNYCNCYLSPAQSAKKAEKSVRRFLKTAGQNNDADAVTAIPARRLPSANARNAPQKKRGVLITWPTKLRVGKLLGMNPNLEPSKKFYRLERKSTKRPRAWTSTPSEKGETMKGNDSFSEKIIQSMNQALYNKEYGSIAKYWRRRYLELYQADASDAELQQVVDAMTVEAVDLVKAHIDGVSPILVFNDRSGLQFVPSEGVVHCMAYNAVNSVLVEDTEDAAWKGNLRGKWSSSSGSGFAKSL
jgi:hypothetical protein